MHVALLRGINVGGKNKLPMKALVSIFEDLDCRDVCTYIQSGNVIFRAPSSVVRTLPAKVPEAIARRFGFRVPVVTRSAREMARIAGSNPFLRGGPRIEWLHVAFLDRKPGPSRAAKLDPDRSPPDRFDLRGRELYLCCPNGMARTKLTNAYLDSTLATTSTVRNWKTVLKLAEMVAAE